MTKFVQRFVRDEDGATMVEYAIMVALIAIVSILTITNVGTDVNRIFGKVQTELAKVKS